MENADHKPTDYAGFAIALSGALLFSTKAIIVKKAFADTSIDALTLLTLRMVFSLPFYLAAAFLVSKKEGKIKMTRRQWLITLTLGLLGYYISSLFDFLGLQYISAGLERLILFLYPTFSVLINAFIFKQKLYRNQQLALLFTYAGIALAYFGELQLEHSNPQFFWGSFLVFLCAVTYSIYISGSGYIIPQVGATQFTAYAMLSATGGIFIHFLFEGTFAALEQGFSLWIYGLLLAVVATVVPSFLLSNAFRRIGTNNVAIVSSIGPVSTILQAHYILGEPIFAAQLAGTGLVLAGIIVLSWKAKK
jgi:drug/metabolite transporter (DMT)-like permease